MTDTNPTDPTVTPTEENPGDAQSSGEGEESTTATDPAPSPSPDYEPCGHPQAHGTCWFSQIAEPCGKRCKWLIDQGEDAGR